MPTIGQTIFVLHGFTTWRKARVVATKDGQLIVRWDNLLHRPLPGFWRLECTPSTQR